MPNDCAGIANCGVRQLIEAALRHERELREADEAATERALELHSAAIDRHLEALNNNHAAIASQAHENRQQMLSLSSTFVTKETYAANDRDDRAWKARVSDELAQMRGATTRQQVLFLAVVAILGVALKFLPPF